MIHECIKCKEDFLTEADPFIVFPKPSGSEFQCLRCYQQREAKLVEALKDLMVLAPQAHDFNDKCFYRGIPPNVEWFCGCGTDDKIKKCVEVLKELGVEV